MWTIFPSHSSFPPRNNFIDSFSAAVRTGSLDFLLFFSSEEFFFGEFHSLKTKRSPVFLDSCFISDFSLDLGIELIWTICKFDW